MMKAVIYFSFSKRKLSKKVAFSIEGDHYEIFMRKEIKRIPILTMIRLGYWTIRNKDVEFEVPPINFDNYSEIDLVFPIWASRPAIFMSKYLEKNKFKNKKVRFHLLSDSGNNVYGNDIERYLDQSNNVLEVISYKKGTKL